MAEIFGLAARLGEALSKTIEHRHFSHGLITVSIGAAATSDPRNSDAATLFSHADEALDHAREAGRNRVVVDSA